MKQRLLLLGLCACALACDSASPVAPSGTVLSISANPTRINLSGESSTITVTGFKPDGNPLNPGTQILVATDIGDLFHAETGERVSVIEVAGSGQAAVLLRGDGRMGSATVTATLTTGGEASATATVTIGEGPDSQPSLIVSANPTSIDVGETSEISILARASDNTPLGAGERIRLTADLGRLVASDGDENSSSITEAFTDGNGEAFVRFIAGSRAGSGTVSAILGTSEETFVTVDIRDAPADFTFQVDKTTVNAGGDSLVLTAIVVNAENDVLQSIVVRFDASIGGTFTPGSSVITNSAGTAEATLALSDTELSNVGVGNQFSVSATVTIEDQPQTKSRTITVQ